MFHRMNGAVFVMDGRELPIASDWGEPLVLGSKYAFPEQICADDLDRIEEFIATPNTLIDGGAVINTTTPTISVPSTPSTKRAKIVEARGSTVKKGLKRKVSMLMR